MASISSVKVAYGTRVHAPSQNFTLANHEQLQYIGLLLCGLLHCADCMQCDAQRQPVQDSNSHLFADIKEQ